MIKVTTLNNREIAINPDLIETVEAVPQTVLTLTSGKKILLSDKIQDVIDRFINYKQLINMSKSEVNCHEKI